MAKRRLIKIEEVKPLLDQGLSYQQIGDILGYKRVSIGFFCRRHFGYMSDKGAPFRRNISFTQEQKEILFGTLLGDAGVYKRSNRKSYFGEVSHCIAQLDYANYIRSFFDSDLVSDITQYCAKENHLVKRPRQMCRFHFRDNWALKEFRDMFYDSQCKKDIPQDLSLLTPRAIAFWFMDDGCSRGRHSVGLCTLSFSMEGLKRLQKYLDKTYNIKVIIRKDHSLYVRTESTHIFYNLVMPYMHSSLMYKLEKIKI